MFSPHTHTHAHTVLPVEPEELVEADLRVPDAEHEVEHVRGNHGDQVQFELKALHVALTQFPFILHQKTLFQVPCIGNTREPASESSKLRLAARC